MTDEKKMPDQETNQPSVNEQPPQQPQQPPQQPQQPQQHYQNQQYQQQYQQPPQQQPQKKSKKGCLIGCLVVFLIFAIALSVLGFVFSRHGGNIFMWALDRFLGDASSITDIFETDNNNGDSRTTTTTTEADRDEGTTTERRSDEPPTTDARGDDVSEMPRYPGSVRTDASRLDFGNEIQYIQTFIVQADMDEIKDYFLQEMPNEGWQNLSHMTIDDQTIITADHENGETSIVISIEEGRYEGYNQISIMMNQKKDDSGNGGATDPGDIEIVFPVYPGAEEINAYEVETSEMLYHQKQFTVTADIEDVKDFHIEWLESSGFRETMSWSSSGSATIAAERDEDEAKSTVVINIQTVEDDGEVIIDFIYQVEFKDN